MKRNGNGVRGGGWVMRNAHTVCIAATSCRIPVWLSSRMNWRILWRVLITSPDVHRLSIGHLRPPIMEAGIDRVSLGWAESPMVVIWAYVAQYFSTPKKLG